VVHVYYSMPIVKLKSVDVVSSDFFTDSYFYISWRDDRYLTLAADGDAYDDASGWKADPEIMNSEETAIDMSGNFFVSHGPALFTGLPKSTGGAWIVGFARLARKYYAQYDLKQFPFDVQIAEILFESYAYNRDKLIWAPSSTLADTMLPKGFVVDGDHRIQGIGLD